MKEKTLTIIKERPDWKNLWSILLIIPVMLLGIFGMNEVSDNNQTFTESPSFWASWVLLMISVIGVILIAFYVRDNLIKVEQTIRIIEEK